MVIDKNLSREAKAIVSLAFREGPLEDIHAGKICPTCHGSDEFSHITQSQMKRLMKFAVNYVYALLKLKESDPEGYRMVVGAGNMSTIRWDEPEDKTDIPELHRLLRKR